LLFNFLKGSALFTSTDTYHVVYSNIAGLADRVRWRLTAIRQVWCRILSS
jgi:hypothetical protein